MQEMPGHPRDLGEAVPALILADDEARSDNDPRRSPAEAQLVARHWQILAFACGALVLSLLLEVRCDDHAAFVFLPDWPIPSSCPSQTIFHVDCPGCGLTRSLIYLAHGDWQRSLAKHRLGWLFALVLVLQIPYRLVALLGRNRLPLGQRFPKLFGMALIVALIGNWALLICGI
ncbi:MAG: DUF2752 domain-containing protein [Thermoguttaceae bacterium]